jgi:hypothetical protein
MIKKSIFLMALLSSFPTYSAQNQNIPIPDLSQGMPPPVRFESPEHRSIGAAVMLRMPGPLDDPSTVKGKSGDAVWVKHFNSSSGTNRLTYADIVWMSGDLIAEPGESIGLSKTPEKTLDLNLNAYEKYQSYIPEILEVYRQMQNELNSQISSGNRLDIAHKYDYRFNSATGGWGGIASLVNWGLYLNLADSNFDHFGKQAVKTYLTAHEKALNTAANATSLDDLRTAYFIDGFGAHFLSDLFAAGHIRVPRSEMAQLCNSFMHSVSLAAKDMHDMDGDSGLTFVNGRGDTWFGKGDKNYYTKENTADRARVIETLQQSVDQIYRAFLSKDPNLESNKTAMLQIMPDIEAIKSKNRETNPPYFFVSDDGNVIYQTNKRSTDRFCN